MVPLTQHRNRTVFVETSPIVENAIAKTFLTADIAAASGTLTVANIEKFTIADYVWLNPFSERSEIIAVHASTTPTGSTITLAANTTYAHYTGEPVYYAEFNQVEISHADTLAGSKSVLATVALEAGRRKTSYIDTAETAGFYFARFRDSVATTFGGYSDGIAYGGFARNTVGYMIETAMRSCGATLGEKISVQDCYDFINDGMLEIKGKRKRWPEHYKDNQIIGQTSRGINVVAMPSDIYDSETNKSIVGFRIGTGRNLQYLDPSAFDNLLFDVAVTQVRTEASANDTSLDVDNSYDFEDSGTLSVYVDGEKDSFTYTGVTRDDATGATAAFTGVPSSGDNAIGQTTAVDINVWQNEVEGIPYCYTVRNGQIEFWYLPDGSEDDKNIYLDYNATATAVDTEGDEIDFGRADILQPYLAWRVYCKDKLNGELNQQSGWHQQYKERLNDTLRTMDQGRVFPMYPRINKMSRGNRSKYDWIQNLPPDQQ